MKTNTRKIITISVALTLLVTVISCIFSYIAMAHDFDHTLGYFNLGSVSGALALYLPIIVPVIAVVCCFLIRKKTSFHEIPAVGVSTVFTSVLVGLLMMASAYFIMIADHPLSKLEIGVAVFTVLSAIYFIILPFCNGKSFMVLLSFIPGIWASLKLLQEYFREGGPINSPIRTINLTMLAFLLLFFAEEIRFGINTQLSGSYYFCILSAIAFTGNAVFPKIGVIFSDANKLFEFDFMEWCLGAAIFLFLIARLISLPSALGNYIPPQKKKSKRSPAGPAVEFAESTDNGKDTIETIENESNENK